MKTTAVLAFAALAASAVSAIDIPAEHHQRFLREQASIADELAQWKDSVAGQVAKKHGFFKESSSGNSIQIESLTVDEDHLKRFFLTKLSIIEAQKANPEATFSVNTPFTLMTDAEFAQHVKRSSGTVDGLNALAASNQTLAVEQPATNNVRRNLATSLDWTTSGCVAGVKDQGDCGSCWAFSSIASLESANCLKNGALQLFSEQQVTSCDPQSSGCDGGWPAWALSYLKGFGGVCTESSYPYTSGDSGDSGDSGYCSTSGCTKKALTISSVTSVSASETALITAITKQPVAVAVAAGNTAWKQYTSGVVSSCSTTALDHAVLAVGYDATSFKLKNQWGTSWGASGFINLKRNGASSACSIINTHNVYPTLA